ncbi:chemotaxis protein CheX [Anaerovibrio sp. RM50]|uniref:chemotaxis protein CheX n=1 Tax=Anaerovibrio sp. RM50 TaxID=1200557 RepID=UPI0012EB18C0|nr:chemotaxis protein CheX [Anaerovibrio sp. RM50]
MGNRYFSQYLLNTGVLDSDNIGYVMPKSAHAVPQLYVLAVQKGLLSEAQVEELAGADDPAKTLTDNKFLSDDQMASLKSDNPDRAACIAQVLLDEKLTDLKALNRCFRESDSDEIHPVVDAVKKIVSSYEDLNPVGEIYGGYAEMLISALQRLMNTDAVVLTDPAEPVIEDSIIVSQSMGGAISVSAAILTNEEAFLEMARRYSSEDFTVIDEMAEDSLAEFVNVINGLYIVEQSGQDVDMDLDTPKIGRNVCPGASSLVAMRIVTDFGSFVLYLAEDEFMY